jgi:membrane protein
MPDSSPQPAPRPERGGGARAPTQIPARGWLDILLRTWREIGRDNVAIVAGGLAYYTLLAFFPTLVLLVSIYGLMFDKAQVAEQLRWIALGLPGGVRHIVETELNQIASSSSRTLGFSAAGGLLFALYSVTRGAGGLIVALNIAYEVEEKRGFFYRTALSFALALMLLGAGLVSFVLVAGLPVAVEQMHLPVDTQWAVLILKWPLLGALLMGVLAVLYRYAPHRRQPRWRWITPGAAAATALWLLGSLGFTVYVANFGHFNATYGSLGALIVLLMWMYLSGYVVLLGGELNSEAERQSGSAAAAA